LSTETQEQATARIVQQAAEAAAKVVQQAAQATAMVKANENTALVTAVAVMQTEIAALKVQNVELNKIMNKIFEKLDEIAQGRPTWAVAIIISVLISICVGLIVFTVTHA
jgi:hypothetical protein